MLFIRLLCDEKIRRKKEFTPMPVLELFSTDKITFSDTNGLICTTIK
jgi:hypothetical protein